MTHRRRPGRPKKPKRARYTVRIDARVEPILLLATNGEHPADYIRGLIRADLAARFEGVPERLL